jgi:hypothetical protein
MRGNALCPRFAKPAGMTNRLLLALVLVGCSAPAPSGSGAESTDAGTVNTGGSNTGSDPSDGSGSNPSGGIPDTITISGQAIVQDQTTETPQSGVAIAVYANGDDTTALATATTDGSGNYSVTLTTNGQAIDGYIKATKSGLVDTYVYPPAPMASDSSTAAASMISTSNYSELVGIEGASTSKGMIILDVLDSTLSPVQGVTVASTPASGKTYYMNSSDEPFSTSSTYSDGLAFLFDVSTSGTVMVGATKSGMTFGSHAVTARGNALTTTVVIAQ